MKLNQIASGDAVTQDLLNIVNLNSTLLRQHVEFYTGAGLGSMERSVQDSLSIGSRNINEAYVGQTLEPKYFPVGRKIFGDTARVDVAYERMGMDIPSEIRSQIRRFGIGISNGFHNMLINGDSEKKDDTGAVVSTNQFNGLKKLVPESQKVIAGTNGLKVITGMDADAKKAQQEFLEKLDATIALCRGGNKVIICGAKQQARLNTVARQYIDYTIDTFGKRIGSYNSIPLVNIEETCAGIIGVEKCGTSTNATSLYVVSFGERSDLSFFTVNEGFKVYPMQKVSNFYENMMEFICDSALFFDKSIAKLEGIVL